MSINAGPTVKNLIHIGEEVHREKLQFESDGYNQKLSFVFNEPEKSLGTRIVNALLQPIFFIVGIIMSLALLIVIAIGGIFHRGGFKGYIVQRLVLASRLCSQEVQTEASNRIQTISENGIGSTFTIAKEEDGEQMIYDAAKIIHKDEKENEDREWVIYITGVASSYQEAIGQMGNIYDNTNKNVLAVNHKGLGQTTGYATNKEELLRSVGVAIEYLQEEGVKDLNRIHLWGHSLGGAIACETASKEEYQGINLIMDRSFDKFENAAANFSYAPRPFNWLLSGLMRSILPFDNTENFRNVTGKKTIISAPEDAVIYHSNQARNMDSEENHTLYSYFDINDKDQLDSFTQMTPNHILFHTPQFLKCVKVFHDFQKNTPISSFSSLHQKIIMWARSIRQNNLRKLHLAERLQTWARSAKAAVEAGHYQDK
ncbi:MAG: hypothetical protein S4CHLAM20_01530 [Chlamydiia bacterium]|nr:hypothetical protein [Chlamydiia bacterium]